MHQIWNYILLSGAISLHETRNKIPIMHITENSVLHDNLHNWILCYGPPKMFLSDNGSQFIERLFMEV